MSKSYFQFKKFSIQQDKCAMKIGTDSVLLGAWSNVTNAKEVLDIGTGTGIIALMVAQRCLAQIVGLEIDPLASSQATENVEQSPWKERISIVNGDITKYVPKKRFDCIISNPPYYEANVLSPNKKRSIARSTSSLSFDTLIHHAIRVASDKASFHFILPYEVYDKFVYMCDCENLFLQRCTKISTKRNKQPKRVLLSFTNYRTPQSIVFSELLLMDENGQKTFEHKCLTKDYYL